MTSMQYLLIFFGACIAAAIVFFALLERHRIKHDEKMSSQERFIWGAALLLGVCFVVTVVQIVDVFWVSEDDLMESMRMR